MDSYEYDECVAPVECELTFNLHSLKFLNDHSLNSLILKHLI